MSYGEFVAMVEAGTITPETAVIETREGGAGMGRLARDIVKFDQAGVREAAHAAPSEPLPALQVKAVYRLKTSRWVLLTLLACAFWGFSVQSRISSTDGIAGAILFPILGLVYWVPMFFAGLLLCGVGRIFGFKTPPSAQIARLCWQFSFLSALSLGFFGLIYRTPAARAPTAFERELAPRRPNSIVQHYRANFPNDPRNDDEITVWYAQEHGLDKLKDYPDFIADHERIYREAAEHMKKKSRNSLF